MPCQHPHLAMSKSLRRKRSCESVGCGIWGSSMLFVSQHLAQGGPGCSARATRCRERSKSRHCRKNSSYPQLHSPARTHSYPQSHSHSPSQQHWHSWAPPHAHTQAQSHHTTPQTHSQSLSHRRARNSHSHSHARSNSFHQAHKRTHHHIHLHNHNHSHNTYPRSLPHAPPRSH